VIEALNFHQYGAVLSDCHKSMMDTNPEEVTLADGSGTLNPIKVNDSKECDPLLVS